MTQTLKLATYCLFKYNDKYLFIKRGDTNYMNGYWSIPAGKIDEGEDIYTGTIREMNEELDLNLTKDKMKIIHTLFRHDAGWVEVFFETELQTDQLNIKEPNKITEIVWKESFDALPQPHIKSVKEAIINYQNNVHTSIFSL